MDWSNFRKSKNSCDLTDQWNVPDWATASSSFTATDDTVFPQTDLKFLDFYKKQVPICWESDSTRFGTAALLAEKSPLIRKETGPLQCMIASNGTQIQYLSSILLTSFSYIFLLSRHVRGLKNDGTRLDPRDETQLPAATIEEITVHVPGRGIIQFRVKIDLDGTLSPALSEPRKFLDVTVGENNPTSHDFQIQQSGTNPGEFTLQSGSIELKINLQIHYDTYEAEKKTFRDNRRVVFAESQPENPFKFAEADNARLISGRKTPSKVEILQRKSFDLPREKKSNDVWVSPGKLHLMILSDGNIATLYEMHNSTSQTSFLYFPDHQTGKITQVPLIDTGKGLVTPDEYNYGFIVVNKMGSSTTFNLVNRNTVEPQKINLQNELATLESEAQKSHLSEEEKFIYSFRKKLIEAFIGNEHLLSESTLLSDIVQKPGEKINVWRERVLEKIRLFSNSENFYKSPTSSYNDRPARKTFTSNLISPIVEHFKLRTPLNLEELKPPVAAPSQPPQTEPLMITAFTAFGKDESVGTITIKYLGEVENNKGNHSFRLTVPDGSVIDLVVRRTLSQTRSTYNSVSASINGEDAKNFKSSNTGGVNRLSLQSNEGSTLLILDPLALDVFLNSSRRARKIGPADQLAVWKNSNPEAVCTDEAKPKKTTLHLIPPTSQESGSICSLDNAPLLSFDMREETVRAVATAFKIYAGSIWDTSMDRHRGMSLDQITQTENHYLYQRAGSPLKIQFDRVQSGETNFADIANLKITYDNQEIPFEYFISNGRPYLFLKGPLHGGVYYLAAVNKRYEVIEATHPVILEQAERDIGYTPPARSAHIIYPKIRPDFLSRSANSLNPDEVIVFNQIQANRLGQLREAGVLPDDFTKWGTVASALIPNAASFNRQDKLTHPALYIFEEVAKQPNLREILKNILGKIDGSFLPPEAKELYALYQKEGLSVAEKTEQALPILERLNEKLNIPRQEASALVAIGSGEERVCTPPISLEPSEETTPPADPTPVNLEELEEAGSVERRIVKTGILFGEEGIKTKFTVDLEFMHQRVIEKNKIKYYLETFFLYLSKTEKVKIVVKRKVLAERTKGRMYSPVTATAYSSQQSENGKVKIEIHANSVTLTFKDRSKIKLLPGLLVAATKGRPGAETSVPLAKILLPENKSSSLICNDVRDTSPHSPAGTDSTTRTLTFRQRTLLLAEPPLYESKEGLEKVKDRIAQRYGINRNLLYLPSNLSFPPFPGMQILPIKELMHQLEGRDGTTFSNTYQREWFTLKVYYEPRMIMGENRSVPIKAEATYLNQEGRQVTIPVKEEIYYLQGRSYIALAGSFEGFVFYLDSFNNCREFSFHQLGEKIAELHGLKPLPYRPKAITRYPTELEPATMQAIDERLFLNYSLLNGIENCTPELPISYKVIQQIHEKEKALKNLIHTVMISDEMEKSEKIDSVISLIKGYPYHPDLQSWVLTLQERYREISQRGQQVSILWSFFNDFLKSELYFDHPDCKIVIETIANHSIAQLTNEETAARRNFAALRRAVDVRERARRKQMEEEMKKLMSER